MSLSYSKCYPDSFSPTRATSGSVGFDLYSHEHVVLSSSKMCVVATGIKATPPPGSYIRIAPRSGLASKGILVNGGVIDPDYTGEIKVILHNLSNRHYIIAKGMKIAQMIIEKVEIPNLIQVVVIITESERGSRGFGSSGD